MPERPDGRGRTRGERLAAAQEWVDRAAQRETSDDPTAAFEAYEEALAVLNGAEDDPMRANILRWMGTVQRETGNLDKAEPLYAASLEIATRLEDLGAQAHALNCMGIVAQRLGDLDGAARQFRRARRLASRVGDQRLIGMIEQNHGIVANIRGDLDGALTRYRNSLRAFEAAKDEQALSWVLNNMGMLQSDLKLYAEAERTLGRGLEIARARGDQYVEGALEANRCEALVGQCRWDDARAACHRAAKIAVDRGDRVRIAEAMRFQAIIERETGRIAEATEILERAYEMVEELDPLLTAEILVQLGECSARSDDRESARSYWRNAADAFRALGALLEAVATESRLSALGLAS